MVALKKVLTTFGSGNENLLPIRQKNDSVRTVDKSLILNEMHQSTVCVIGIKGQLLFKRHLTQNFLVVCFGYVSGLCCRRTFSGDILR